MKRNLVFKSKLLSLRGQMWVYDDASALVYNVARAKIFSTTLLVNDQSGRQCASLKRKNWSLNPSWLVESDFGECVIKRKIITLSRKYWVESGPFDGVTVEGSFTDTKFSISRGEKTIAHAIEPMVSIGAKHAVEILDDSEHSTLLSVVLSVVVIKDKLADRAAHDSDDD